LSTVVEHWSCLPWSGVEDCGSWSPEIGVQISQLFRVVNGIGSPQIFKKGTRVSAPILGTSFGIASASRTEDSLDTTFLEKYCSGKTLTKYLKSMKEIKFF